MKKLFVSILTLAAFAACQSDFNDVNFDAPQGGNANVGGSHTVYAEVGVGEEDTKATYGDDLSAMWEENDQIALLQEHANYDATFSVVNKLNIKEGWGTNKALFSGNISVDATAPRVYHIAYPASAVTFNTSMTQSVTVTDYAVGAWTGLGYKGKATGYGVCTYNSTLNITVPTTQYGKWEPYMYASTEEGVDANAIGARTLNTLTGAIAIRAFEPDEAKTPKKLKQITITSSNAAIAGAFTGTATSVGHTQTITGAETGNYYDDGDRETEAINNLTSALQGYTATTTTQTKALSLSFNGGSNTITATNLETIAKDAEDKYTYHLNVAPFEGQDLTIELMDAKGLTMKCNVSAKSLSAGHRLGYEIKWVYEEASLTGEYIKTWYENPTDTTLTFADNTIHVGKLEIIGNIEAENVIEMGVMVNNTLYGTVKKTLSRDAFDIPLSSGDYNVYAYAKVNLNGEETILKAHEDNYTVTPAYPELTGYSVVSSYSKDGKDFKDNDIDGRSLKVTAKLSNDYFANNGLVEYSKVFNNGTELGNLTDGAWSEDVALGQYSCYVEIKLKNGYIFKSDAYTTHVTGIPYSVDLNGKSSIPNWSNSRTSKNEYLCLKEGTAYAVSMPFGVSADCNVVVTIPMYAYGGSLPSNYKPTVYASATSSTSGSASGASIQLKGSNLLPNAGASYTNWTPTVTLSNSAKRLSIYANGSKYWSSVGGGDMGVIMKSVTVQYKL